MTPEQAMGLVDRIVYQYPGLVYPKQAPVSAGGLVGMLEKEFAKANCRRLQEHALCRLPQPKEH